MLTDFPINFDDTKLMAQGFINQMIYSQQTAQLLSQAEADTRCREETQKRIAELQDFIGSQQSEITEFDESLVLKPIQQITVYDDHFTVRFKSGLEIDINE